MARTVQHPTAVARQRRENSHVRAAFPVGSIMDFASTRRELAPQVTPPETAFAEVGHRRAMVTRPVNALSIAEWRGVMGWPFKGTRGLTPRRIPIAPFQGHNPFAERVNIDMTPQTTLGSMSSIKVAPITGPAYVKLGVLR